MNALAHSRRWLPIGAILGTGPVTKTLTPTVGGPSRSAIFPTSVVVRSRPRGLTASVLIRLLAVCLSVSWMCGWLPRSTAADLTFGPPEAAGFSPAHLKRLDAEMAKHVLSNRMSGMVVLVARRGHVGYLKAVGRRVIEAGLPMETNTLFRIASMSKLVTSVGMMMLIDAGAARLDDPVSKYIPEFAAPKIVTQGDRNRRTRDSTREITLRHLLTHTSGITYRFNGQVPLAAMYGEAGICDGLAPCEGTVGEMVRVLARQPLWFTPGTAWEYGLSTDVLGHVIEVVSGVPLDQYMKERVFDPLGMTDTCFHVPEERLGRLAAVYGPAPGGGLRRVPDLPFTTNGPTVCSPSHVYPSPGTYFSGGAGLVSTATDYARLLQMLLNGGELAGRRLLTPQGVLRLTTNAIANLSTGPGFTVGMGSVTIATSPTVGEWPGTYSWGGFWNTSYWVDPIEQVIIIALSQLYPADGVANWDTDVARAAYEAMGETRLHFSGSRPSVTLRWRLSSLVPKPGRQLVPGWQIDESVDLATWQPWGAAIDASVGAARTVTRSVPNQPGVHFYRVRVVRDFAARELPAAILVDADLRGAILRGANLQAADLSRADLREADLTGTILRSANLTEANLLGAVGLDADQEGTVYRNTVMPDGSLRSN